MYIKELKEFIKDLPDGMPVRIGSFYDDVEVCQIKKVIYNGEKLECLQISSEEEN